MSDKDFLAVEIEGALNRYPLINLERGDYDAIAGTAAQACVDAGYVPTASAERAAELQAERDALTATVQRVRALHHEGRMEFVTDQRCINEDCDHTDECPTEPLTVCSECWRNAEEADAYFGEHRCPDFVMWPCPTIRALDATATDGCVSEHSPATNPDCEMAPDDVVDGMRSRPEDEEATDV